MYLFILESFGTSELILIGIVALIVFGPRKLPQMAKTIGKTIADFKRTTNEFKSTWEKEVDIEGIKKESSAFTNDMMRFEDEEPREKPRQLAEQGAVQAPEIKEISSDEMEKIMASKEVKTEKSFEEAAAPKENDKRSWL